jgi:tetratricopeptide (TPR) repeat protein
MVAYYRNRFDDARSFLGKAREAYVTISGERSTEVAAIETLLGATARAAGDLDAAEQHHRTALEIDRALRGPDHFDISRDLHNLAGIHRLKKNLDAAFTTYQQALAIEVAKRGERSVQAGLTHNSLGLVKLERGDRAGARTEFELALDILTKAGHGDRAFAEHNLGLVAAAAGDHALALAAYDRAAELFKATIGDTALASIRLHLDRARSLAAIGRRDQARLAAATALRAATDADIPWIVDDAKALLATLAPTAVAVTS